MRLLLFLITIVLSCLSISAEASVDSDLNNYFSNLGFNTNTTAPNVYQGQQAGYYTGGSLYARNSVRDLQIAQVSLPSFRSGCGGIDLFTGGFSFVNSQQLISMMKNIMSNAAGFAFNLALEEATPELANSMKYLNTLASDVNKMNMNSCETAAGLVGSVWPRTHEAQQQVCQDIGSNTGIFSDYAAAHQGCGVGGQMTSTLNGASGPYKNMVMNNANLAWKALQQNTFLQNDPELAELFMSLSGTVIINNTGNSDDSNQKFTVLSSLASDKGLLKALLHGGTATMYSCNGDTSPDGCLNPVTQTLNVSNDDALETQVTNLLTDMTNKIYSDQPLTSEEVGLLNATRLPVYKMLNVQAAFTGNSSMVNIQDYADVIATDILFQYLEESLSILRANSASLQYPSDVMDKFNRSIDLARASVQASEQSAYQQVSMAAQLINQTQSMETMLAGSLSSHLTNTLTWANNLREQN